jgi:acetylornithine/succinyldiaminopimelate/putrescine aminotransferase
MALVGRRWRNDAVEQESGPSVVPLQRVDDHGHRIADAPAGSSFDLGALLDSRRGEGPALHETHLNGQVPRLLRTIGFDRVYETARGPYLWDAEGRRYLDMLAGFGVHALGRNHPVVRQALRDVVDRELADLVQFDTPLLPGLLAERLLAHAPGLDRVYFANSGTEAVEAALKFARAATGRPRVLYADHAYHGLTAGSLSVNGAKEFRKGFGPLLPDTRIPLGDLDALLRELRRGDVAAFLVEPIQGKGVNLPPPGFLAAAQHALREHGALLICDEVQTGIARTGRFFAYEYEGVDPDIVTVAKALSGGYVPVGATLAKSWIFDKVYSSLDRVFVHASTFAGNALAMAAGLATLAVIDDEDVVGSAARAGERLTAGLRDMAGRYDLIADVRGRGLMIGIEFGAPSSWRRKASWYALQAVRRGLFAQLVVAPLFQRHRVITQVAGDHIDVIKLLPTLQVDDEAIDWFLDAFDDVMRDAVAGNRLVWEFGRTLVRHAVTR